MDEDGERFWIKKENIRALTGPNLSSFLPMCNMARVFGAVVSKVEKVFERDGPLGEFEFFFEYFFFFFLVFAKKTRRQCAFISLTLDGIDVRRIQNNSFEDFGIVALWRHTLRKFAIVTSDFLLLFHF